jgi:tetratricopeptide (TPR) repeat protein
VSTPEKTYRDLSNDPVVPEEITGNELDHEIRTELSSLGRDRGKTIARHLVMVGLLLDDDPDQAWEHALAAKRLAPRVSSVREATGLAAYRTGRYQEALSELRTARRITGSPAHLPVMADCERGLGRPERALALAESPESRDLDQAGRMELLMVEAGARADRGQLDAALLTLQVPQLRARTKEPWLARLRSAYADALSAVGRVDEARHWMREAVAADSDGAAGIADTILGDEVVFLDDSDDRDDIVPTEEEQNPPHPVTGSFGEESG